MPRQSLPRGVHSGVAARTLRRAAFWFVVLAAGGSMAVDRGAGADAVMVALLILCAYASFVAMPIQLLYRDVRLGPFGVGAFVLAVLAVVGVFWCLPVQRSGVYDGTGGLVALHRLTGGGDLDPTGTAPWTSAALVCGLVAMVTALVLDVTVWRLQRMSPQHAVDPVMAGAVTSSFATLPEPQGGTSVTRPAPTPRFDLRKGSA